MSKGLLVCNHYHRSAQNKYYFLKLYELFCMVFHAKILLPYSLLQDSKINSNKKLR